MNKLRDFAIVIGSMAVLAACSAKNPFNPPETDKATIVISNRTLVDTVTAGYLGQCGATQLDPVLGNGGLIVPSTNWSVNVEKGCHRAVLLGRTDTIAQRAAIQLAAGDTAIVVLQPRPKPSAAIIGSDR